MTPSEAHLSWARPVGPGFVIRIALVLVWLGLLGVHIVRHALPGFLVSERHDLAATLTRQVGRILHYEVRSGSEALGSTSISFETEDAGYRLETTLDLAHLPGLDALKLPGLDANGEGGLRASATQRLNHRLEMTAMVAEGQVLGLDLRLNGSVDDQGLHGVMAINGYEQQLEIPDLERGAGQGFGFALSLPPGLTPGDEFRTTVLDIGMSLKPAHVVAVFTVGAKERIDTADGPLDLLRVAMAKAGEAHATLWCDDDGTVYRSRMARSELSLDLRSIHDRSAGRIWPHFSRP